MGRAMLIMCAGALIAMGFINITTSQRGLMLTEQNVNYAEYVMSKNAAQTAIQMTMQKINKDEDWAETHNENNPWKTTINGRDVELYTVYNPSPDFWEPDELRLISNAAQNGHSVQVISQYLKEPFSSLVPDFVSAMSLPTSDFTFEGGGNASISGKAPSGSSCEDKPAFTVQNEEAKDKLDLSQLQGENVEGTDPLIEVDESLSYQPTDELIERLRSSNPTFVDGNYKGDMGTQENPGVFFVEDSDAKLTGGINEGFGILVIRTTGELAMEDEDGSSIDIAGNFTFNGLVIFENAHAFKGTGTPTINGSVLIGKTDDSDDYFPQPTDINMNGNIHLQYDCEAEQYAKMAAATSIEQYKYTRVVTTEGTNYSYNAGNN